MRLIIFGLGLLLLMVPMAGARSFEMAVGSGDLRYRSTTTGEAMLAIGLIGAGAKIFGPATLIGIKCADGKPLQRCVRLRLRHGAFGIEYDVRRPVKLVHEQAGVFEVVVRGARVLHDVWISGCGGVSLRGRGTYSADGAPPVAYASDARLVNLVLQA